MNRFPVAFFFERLSWTEEIHANWRRKKKFLSCVKGQIYFNFRSFERYKPRITFKIFTFVSQHRLLELLSYGEYNHLYISVTCFLKKTHLSVIVFSHSFLVILISKKTSAYIIFQKLKNIDYSYIVLKTLNNINLNNFSLVDPCCEINFGKKKFENCTKLLCKSFLRIISIKLFVIWQV